MNGIIFGMFLRGVYMALSRFLDRNGTELRRECREGFESRRRQPHHRWHTLLPAYTFHWECAAGAAAALMKQRSVRSRVQEEEGILVFVTVEVAK